MVSIEEVKKSASAILDEVIEYRRHIHQYPELSFQEKETGLYIQQILTKYGIPFTSGWAGYGICAIIKGDQKGPVIALRADMDALPIAEKNSVSYQSKNKGVMHACGHDVHSASLLGTAIILSNFKNSLKGTVKLIFQPGEEKLPGGAGIMIQEGVLKYPDVEFIIGQHVFPSLEAGKVGIRSGTYMASADEIYLEVIGKGGHAAMPHECTDTIYVASQIIIALQQIVSRSASPEIPTVLSFGKFNSDGGATNIIPSRVLIEGTFRTMDEKWREKAHEQIQKVATQTAMASGAECKVEILKGYPVLNNHSEMTEHVKNQMKIFLNEKNVVDLPIRMTSEDFAFYSQVIPAVFYRLGTGNISKGIVSPVHTPTFDIDESALETGMGLMAWLALAGIGN
ncbi:MAG: amidohydrolase [Saprospiraceae bacterium]|nr:amidohydrolase [Saprospiraceae bacterium]